MGYKTLLKSQIEDTYAVTDALIAMVDDAELSWKPDRGENWWTVAQLLRHITVSCGIWCKGFVTGTWGDGRSSLQPTRIVRQRAWKRLETRSPRINASRCP